MARQRQSPRASFGFGLQTEIVADGIDPELVVCDEAVSALDVSIQAQVLRLLLDLKAERNLTYIFITHDLSVTEYICDRIAVMYLGSIVEIFPSKDLRRSTRHPYTRGLLVSVPQIGNKRMYLPTIPGMVPGIGERPQGCYFAKRCEHALDICRQSIPPLDGRGTENRLACWNPYEY